MNISRMVPVALIAVSAGLAVSAGTPRRDSDPKQKIAVRPDPQILEVIRAAVAPPPGRTHEQKEDAFYAGLAAMRRFPPDRLVPQLIYFAAKEADKPRPNEEVSWAVLRLLRTQLSLGHNHVYQTIAPLLESDDAKVRETAAAYFDFACQVATTSLRGGGAYYPLGMEVIPDKEADQPPGLIRFLYTYPGTGLRTMVHRFERDFSPEFKRLLWAEHVIDDTFLRHHFGVLEKNQVDPAAAEQVDKLSRDGRWWVRLYVAAVLRDCPAFRTKALTDRLGRDTNEIVKQTVKDFLDTREERDQ